MALEPLLNVAALAAGSTINGPGRRVVVWVQGCTLGCTGCANPAYQPHEPRHLMEHTMFADKLVELCQRTQCEGVTISGGEPFQQAEALLHMCERLHKREISIIVLSGYSWEAIRRSRNRSIIGLLNIIDAIISGPFNEEVWKRDKGIYKKIVVLSKRYTRADLEQSEQKMEAISCQDGFMLLDFGDMVEFASDIQRIVRSNPLI